MFMKHWKFPVSGWYESAKDCNYSSTSVGSWVTDLYYLSQAGDDVRMVCS